MDKKTFQQFTSLIIYILIAKKQTLHHILDEIRNTEGLNAVGHLFLKERYIKYSRKDKIT